MSYATHHIEAFPVLPGITGYQKDLNLYQQGYQLPPHQKWEVLSKGY